MDVARDAAAETGERTGGGGAEEQRETGEACADTAEVTEEEKESEEGAMMTEDEKTGAEDQHEGRANPDPPDDITEPTPPENEKPPEPPEKNPENNERPPEPPQSSLDKELLALLSGCADPAPLDVLMIQSEEAGMVDIVKVEHNMDDLSVTEKKSPPPPLRPPTTWTSANIREFKHRMASEKHGMLTVRRGEVMTVRVPTHPEGKRLCWEFATDDYDIGFGIYFDWTAVTSTAVTIQVSESSDDEEEEETESPWHSREGDVERGSVYRLRSRYGEIMQVFRRDSHREVQAGSHDYPGEGIYLLKLDNSYSLLRNKTLYFHVYYSS